MLREIRSVSSEVLVSESCIMELINNVATARGGYSVFAGVRKRTREGNDLYHEMIQAGVMDLRLKKDAFGTEGKITYGEICVIEDQEVAFATTRLINNEVVGTERIILKLACDKGDAITKLNLQVLNRTPGNIESIFNAILLAVYVGDDDYIHLKKVVKDVVKAFEQLEAVVVNEEKTFVIKTFVADLKCQASMKGLMGAASRFPCSWCLVSKDDLKVGRQGQLRSQQIAMERCRAGPSSLDNLSHANAPQLDMEKVDFLPATLHAMMGPVNDCNKSMKADVLKISISLCTGDAITPNTLTDPALDAYTGMKDHKRKVTTYKKMNEALTNLGKKLASHLKRQRFAIPLAVIPNDLMGL